VFPPPTSLLHISSRPNLYLKYDKRTCNTNVNEHVSIKIIKEKKKFAIVSWSVVATIVLLRIGLHIHQRTEFQFIAGLVSEIWEFKNQKVGTAYIP